jgi:integrase
MLNLWRRHLKRCPHAPLGRGFTKCSCPWWVDGDVHGQRVRQSLGTTNAARAARLAAELEKQLAGDSDYVPKPVADAVTAFILSCDVEPATLKKYDRIGRYLSDYLLAQRVQNIGDVLVEHIDQYKLTRKLMPLTWSKELQVLRQFFSFCLARKWVRENPAKAVKMPRDPKPREKRPYTTDEVSSILAACDNFGRGPYERARAKAIVLLLRKYALRLSDVATLSRDRIKGNQIFLHALKNGAAIWLPLYEDVRRALECVPVPHGADADCKYFFWTGKGSVHGHVNTIERTLQAVFRKSGVENAHAHRFRHTLATEILANGGSIETVASILGDDPATIERHYSKHSVARQKTIVDALASVHGPVTGTFVAREENDNISSAFSRFPLVLEVGVEPTCPVKDAGF